MHFVLKKKSRYNTSICILSFGAYSLLTNKDLKYIIGPDVHQVTLAQELKKFCFNLSIITYAPENGIEYINGLKIIKIKRPDSNASIFLIIKLLRLLKAFIQSDSDIYFQHGALSGIIVLLCKIFQKKFVYYMGSDALADRSIISHSVKSFNKSNLSIDGITTTIEISLADAVIVQNGFQKSKIKINLGKDALLIPKHIFSKSITNVPKSNPPIILWVGSIAEVKQPNVFLDLAKAIPNAKFLLIGGYSKDNGKLFRSIIYQYRTLSNFEYIGVVPLDKIEKYFSLATILVNTSLVEAYPPYTFLQAWSNGTAVVSLSDNSDKILTRFDLGLQSSSFQKLVEDVKLLLDDKSLREKLIKNGKNYVDKNFNTNDIINKYINLFNTLNVYPSVEK